MREIEVEKEDLFDITVTSRKNGITAYFAVTEKFIDFTRDTEKGLGIELLSAINSVRKNGGTNNVKKIRN